MTVEGLFNPSHVLRAFIASEYAFSITYPKQEIRIAHSKGSWYCVKLKEKDFVNDSIQIQDCFSGHFAENDMTEALYESLKSQHTKLPPGRGTESLVVEKFLRVWGGKPSSIEKITVVQPGRNACVDPETGEFELLPRIDEFKS